MTSIRDTFIAPPGHVLLLIDLSQVEDRMVKMYCGTKRMVELANTKPWEYDTHSENACAILKKPRVTKVERNNCKMVAHGVQRALGAKGMSETFFSKGIIFSPKQCQERIDNYLAANWEIRDLYFPMVENTVRRDRQLTNSWGRRIRWPYHVIDKALFRKAYSFWPQSCNADLLNQFGVLRPWEWLKATGKRTKLLAQIHDEVIFEAPFDEAYEVGRFVVQSLEQPREVNGAVLSVPADLCIGKSWGGKQEFKRFPSRDEFETKREEIFSDV